MQIKYIEFYKWYRSKTLLKNMIATVVLVFSYVLHYTFLQVLIPSTKAWQHSSLGLLSSKLDEISSYLLAHNFVIVPYVMIVLFLIIFTLYKNIILKTMMAIICLVSLVVQLGVLMGFTSYWHFLYFVPQLILLIIVGKIIFYTRRIDVNSYQSPKTGQ